MSIILYTIILLAKRSIDALYISIWKVRDMLSEYKKRIISVLVGSIIIMSAFGCGSQELKDSEGAEPLSEQVAEEISFPEKYSLIDEKRITPYKNQHQSGMCWAYSTTAAAESALITGGFESEGVDLSEGHICYTVYPYSVERQEGASDDGIYLMGDKGKILLNPYYVGGSPVNAMELFANGVGPVDEEVFPVETDAGQLKKSIENAMQLESEGKITRHMGKYLLTEYDSYETNEEIKYGLMNYGAVTTGVFINEKGLGLDANNEACYYYTDFANPPTNTNHVVTIVGWDDTYSKNNFSESKPKNDGAWLIKDSISSNLNYRNTGYYWLSYDEYHMGNMAMRFSKREDYGTILSYDAVCLGDSIKTEGEYTVIANCYDLEVANSIKAVGVNSCNSDQKIDIEIYINPEIDRPDSGELAYTDSATIDYTGYKVIDLSEPVEVKAGDKIGVVVKYYNIDGKSEIAPVEGDNAVDLGSLAELYIVSNQGESYALSDGKWYDLSRSESSSVFGKTGTLNNARIKLICKRQ